MAGKRAVVILSTADYDAAIWTNKQHIASRLASYREVYYLNSFGLRRPRLSYSDIKRVLARFKSRDDEVRTRPAGLAVISPKLIQWNDSSVKRRFNTFLVKRLRRKLPDEFVLWTFSPITYGLDGEATQTVYHSVDFLHEVEGTSSTALLRAEGALLRRVSTTVASSATIVSHLERMGAPEVRLWENVGDTSLFASVRAVGERAGVIFAGNLSPDKIDFGLLQQLAETGCNLTLVGPTGIDGARLGPELEILLRYQNVSHVGQVSQETLAHLLSQRRVGIIPYRLNHYTEGVFPMKVHEYRAAGLHVISTPLPNLVGSAFSGVAVAADNRFIELVLAALEKELPPRLTAEELAAVSWERRVHDVEEVIRALTGEDKE